MNRAKAVESSLKKKAREESRPIPTLYAEAAAEISRDPDAAALFPTLSQLDTALYRARKVNLPPLPTTRAGIELPER